MTAFVKPMLFSAFAAGSLALAGGQPPEPPRPPQPAVAPFPPGGAGTVSVPRDGHRMIVGGPGGGFGGSMYGPAEMSRPFGDDPRTRELARKLADAKGDEDKEKLRGELKAALAKAFDQRLEGQQKQVEELEKQLKRLKETVGKRKEAKADIVADRLAALEKEARGLGW